MQIHSCVKVKSPRFNVFIYSLLLSVFVFFSCHSKNKFENVKEDNPEWFSKYTFFSNKEYTDFFYSILSKQKDSSCLISKEIFDFYQNKDPFWTYAGFQQENIEKYMTILDSCIMHGLSKEMFSSRKIQLLYDSITKLKINNKNTLYNVLGSLELELTHSYLNYVKVLHFGATNPAIIHPQKFLYKIDTVTSDFYIKSLQTMDQFDLYIDSISPKSMNYLALQNELAKYLTVSDTAILDTFKHTKSYYTDKLIANLERNRWKINPRKGSYYISVNIPEFMVKGYIDDSCYVKLKICCGLTLTKSEREKSILLNHVYPSGKWETPLLYSAVNNIILNPEWNIPYSIMKEEYLHKLQKSNTAIIEKEKLMVFDQKRKRLDPDSLNWKKYSKNNIPYVLVQTAGKHNALGLIKFDFPNPESVYLHDTPNKNAFKKKNRAISHGCCRVENPLDLARFIYMLNVYTEEEIEKVNIMIGVEPVSDFGKTYADSLIASEQKYYENLSDNQKKYYRAIRPSKVRLSKPIPIYIEYYTSYLDENGVVQYFDDVYYKDFGIINQLKTFTQ